MTETAFTTELLKWAKVYHWRSFHVRNSGYGGNTFVQGDRGFPDLVLVRPPRLIFAELKVGKNKTTVDQQRWLIDLDLVAAQATEYNKIGIETYVWKPEQWSEILTILSKG